LRITLAKPGFIEEDGTTLSCTDDHPLWVNNKGWCVVNPCKTIKNYGFFTQRLSISDKLLVLRNGSLKPVALKSIESVTRLSKMWIIGTGDNHTFFANCVLAYDENVGSLNLKKALGVTVEKSTTYLQGELLLV